MVGAGRLGVGRVLGAVVLVLVAACAGRSIDNGGESSEAGAPGAGGSHAGSGGVTASGGSSAHGGSSATGGMTTGLTGGDAVSPGGAGGTAALGGGGTLARPYPPIPTGPLCGNGQHDEYEECDDANQHGSDGCTIGCQVEADWACPLVGPCVLDACGNGRLARHEECDDGNTFDGDGCGGNCVVESGWECPGPGLACRPYCGDSRLVGNESCDDGNRESGDGCSRSCELELPDCRSLDVPPGSGSAGTSASDLACVEPVCGDGVVMAPEDCDDGMLGNDGHYGGCNPDCTYAPYCGDTVIDAAGGEECDTAPANFATGERACTPGCRVAPYCGDGFIDGDRGEQCDSGDRNGHSVCKMNCLLDLK